MYKNVRQSMQKRAKNVQNVLQNMQKMFKRTVKKVLQFSQQHPD